jgi:uroporphyrinogen decarboxylase
MITGRENYQRAIEFRGPEYLPVIIGVDFNWIREKDAAKVARIRELQTRFPVDVFCLNAAFNQIEPGNDPQVIRWVDEWGTGWVDDGHGAKTEIYPLADGYELLADYPFPAPQSPKRFPEIDRKLPMNDPRYFRPLVWFTLFERLWMLRGFENMLIDPYVDRRAFEYLRDQVVEFNLAMIDAWLARGANAIYFSDDWGSQRGLLINPEDWRKLYKPSYTKMFDRVRAGGAHVWMHLCGNITAILPDLIELGLNVLNPVQPQAMDVRFLAREFGGKVCFNGGVDVQGTLIHGSPADVRREVHELVELFGCFNGGYIGGTSHSVMPETPLDNVIALFEAFAEYQH